MGCHLYLYEVITPTFDVDALINSYKNNYQEMLDAFTKYCEEYHFTEPYGKLPYWLFDLEPILFFEDAYSNTPWFANTPTLSWIEWTASYKNGINGLSEKDYLVKCSKAHEIYKDRWIYIPCQDYSYEEERFKDIEFMPFIQLKELSCPWVRTGIYDKEFTTKESFSKFFSKYLKLKKYKEDFQWFVNTFEDGKHLIQTG